MKALIVLPSYNEADNILQLIEALCGQDPGYHVCVVDDSSPDGTAALVEAAIRDRASWAERVALIVRAKKDGRGGAVREGFRQGMPRAGGFDAYVEMDCDFSHEPTAVPEGLRLLRDGFDVVIGARYPAGEILGWPVSRRVFSFCANTLARVLIDWSIADYTNGFRFYTPRAVDVLLAHGQRHKGYIYLSESLTYLLAARMRVAAFPIRFRNRERGVSNTSLREIRSALTGIFSIAARYRLER